jgi:hypothetical protein
MTLELILKKRNEAVNWINQIKYIQWRALVGNAPKLVSTNGGAII